MPLKLSEFIISFITIGSIAAVGFYISPENVGFYGKSPHPYLIIAIVLSGLFGLKVSLIASITLSALYMMFLHMHVDHQDIVSIFSFKFLILPITLILVSALLGERIESLNMTNQDHLTVIHEKNRIIDKLKDLSQQKDKESLQLQQKITSQVSTISTLHEAAKGLSSHELDDLYNNLLELLKNFLKIDECAIYLKQEAHFQLKKSAGINDPQIIPGILDERETHDPIIQSCLQKKDIAHLQDLSNFRYLSETQGKAILAGCFVDKDAAISGLVVVYDMPLLSYVPSNFKLFSLLLSWASDSYLKAEEYNQLKNRTIIDQLLGFYSVSYAEERFVEEFDRSRSHMLPLTIIGYHITNLAAISRARRPSVLKTLAKIIQSYTRKIDANCLTRVEYLWVGIYPIQRPDETDVIIQNILSDLEKLPIEINETGEYIQVVMKSATFDAEMETPEELWKQVGIDEKPFTFQVVGNAA